jgi:hypothetical protein
MSDLRTDERLALGGFYGLLKRVSFWYDRDVNERT